KANCPYCGAGSELHSLKAGHAVACNRCGATGGVRRNVAEAIKAWEETRSPTGCAFCGDTGASVFVSSWSVVWAVCPVCGGCSPAAESEKDALAKRATRFFTAKP